MHTAKKKTHSIQRLVVKHTALPEGSLIRAVLAAAPTVASKSSHPNVKIICISCNSLMFLF